MTSDNTTKAVRDAIQVVIGQAVTCTQLLDPARAVDRLGTPDDLAGSLRTAIHKMATGNEAINGLLPISEVTALAEAYHLVKPRSIRATVSSPLS